MPYPDLSDTIVLVDRLHDGQVDKLGAPYYFHAMRVMMRLGPSASEDEKHAAMLHDALEDVQYLTPDRLRELGYSAVVLTMLDILTRPAGMPYSEYIDRIVACGNAGVMRIKLADLYDNTCVARMDSAPDEVREKLIAMGESRYIPAIAKLRLALGKLADSVISGEIAAAPSTLAQGAAE